MEDTQGGAQNEAGYTLGIREQFMTVTPFSKYLALTLFILFPIFGFVLGYHYASAIWTLKYNTVAESYQSNTPGQLTVAECEDLGGTVTIREGMVLGDISDMAVQAQCLYDDGNRETNVDDGDAQVISFDQDTGEIRLVGRVAPGGQDSCPVDGVCSIMVGSYEVEWARGWSGEPGGTIYHPVEIGDEVEVFGKRSKDQFITIYGSQSYYVRMVQEDTPLKSGALVPPEMRSCSVDSDCTYVETLCSSCCGHVGINRAHEDEYYTDTYTPACSGYSGSVCDCVGPTESRCVDNMCTVLDEVAGLYHRDGLLPEVTECEKSDWSLGWQDMHGLWGGMNVAMCGTEVPKLEVRAASVPSGRLYAGTVDGELAARVRSAAEVVVASDVPEVANDMVPDVSIVLLEYASHGESHVFEFSFNDMTEEIETLYDILLDVKEFVSSEEANLLLAPE